MLAHPGHSTGTGTRDHGWCDDVTALWCWQAAYLAEVLLMPADPRDLAGRPAGYATAARLRWAAR
jgi:hypothetical protein